MMTYEQALVGWITKSELYLFVSFTFFSSEESVTKDWNNEEMELSSLWFDYPISVNLLGWSLK